METVLVQINNTKAYRLLEDLEDLDIIKVLEKNGSVKKVKDKVAVKKNLPADYFGLLTIEEGNKFETHINTVRKQWGRVCTTSANQSSATI